MVGNLALKTLSLRSAVAVVVAEVAAALEQARERRNEKEAGRIRERYAYRMHDLSEFMKMLLGKDPVSERLLKERREQILDMIFGEEGLKPGIVKMFFDPFQQKEPGGPFDAGGHNHASGRDAGIHDQRHIQVCGG